MPLTDLSHAAQQIAQQDNSALQDSPFHRQLLAPCVQLENFSRARDRNCVSIAPLENTSLKRGRLRAPTAQLAYTSPRQDQKPSLHARIAL